MAIAGSKNWIKGKVNRNRFLLFIEELTMSELLQDSIASIMGSVLQYAEGANPEGRNFFSEMNNSPEFQKSYQEFLTKQKQKGLSDTEVVQAQLVSMMLENDFMGLWGDGEHTYYDDDFARSSALLRKAGESEGPRLIKNHRRLQLANFAKVSDGSEPGLFVNHKKKGEKVSEADEKKMQDIASILVNDFFFMPGSTDPDFVNVLGAMYEDFFDLDKICFFKHKAKDNTPLGLILIDPEMVKPIVPKRNFIKRWDEKEYVKLLEEANAYNIEQNNYIDDFRFVLMNKHKTRVAKFKADVMFVSHFFRRSVTDDLFRGQSIIEQGIRMITSIINSIEFNASSMTNNRAPQGILSLSGGANINPIVLEKFKKMLWAQTMGAGNAWRIPIIALPDKNQMQWVPFRQSNRDLEFFNWMSLLFTILCRFSGTDPEEISIASNRGVMQSKNSLFQQGGNEGTSRRSMDSGLRTYLGYIAMIINKTGVVKELAGHDEWVCGFGGLDVKDEAAQAELNSKQLASTLSLNEVRKAEGKNAIDLEISGLKIGELVAIGNPQIFQMYMMLIQQKQQEEMQQQQQQMAAMQGGGAPGAGPEGGGQMPAGQEAAGQEQGEPTGSQMTPNDVALLQQYGNQSGNEDVEKTVQKTINMIKANWAMKRKIMQMEKSVNPKYEITVEV